MRRRRRPPAPPGRAPCRLRRRLPRHLPPALVLPRRAGVGLLAVDPAGPGPRARRAWAEGPAGDRQHVAHDGAGPPQARGRGRPPARRAPADGLLPGRDARGRGGPPRRGAGDPDQPGLRGPARQGVRLRAHVPPRHRLRAPRRLLARAPPRGVRAPLLPVAGRRVRRPARRDRAPDGRGTRCRRWRRGPARAAARVAAQRHVVCVRPPLRPGAGSCRQGGPRAEPARGRRLRPAGQAQLVRPPPLARPLRPAGHPCQVRPAGAPREPLRRRHHRRPPAVVRPVRRQGLHGRPARPPRRRQARRLRHGRGALGDGVPRDGHGGRADGVGPGPARAAPGRAGPGAPGAGPRRRARPGRGRVRRGLARLPPRRGQGGPAPPPAGPAAVLGPPSHVGRTRGRVPRPRWHHRHGEHVGHNPRWRRLGRADGVPARAVRRAGVRGVLRDGLGSPAGAVWGRPEELPGEEPRHGHRGVLARHAAPRVRAAPLPRPGTWRPAVGDPEAVVRDGHPAGTDAEGSSTPGGLN